MQILDYSVKTHFYDIVYNIYDNWQVCDYSLNYKIINDHKLNKNEKIRDCYLN